MIAEHLVLVALFHIALLGGRRLLGCQLFLPALVALSKPPAQVDGIGRGKGGLDALQNGQAHGAVGALATLGLHKVDGGVAHEVGDEQVVGLGIHGQGGVILLQNAVVDQADLGGQGHGLHLVMGDVDEGGAGLQVQALQFVAHLQAELGIQVAQRLIHEQHQGFGGQGTGDGHALLLTAGQLRRIPIHEHANLHDPGHPAHGQVDLLPGELAHGGVGLAAPDHLEVLGNEAGCSGRVHLGLQGGDLAGHIPGLFQMVGKELLGGVLGDGKGVDQLDDGLLFVQLALLVPAFVQHLGHVLGAGEDLGQPGGVLELEIVDGHLFLDIGQAEGDVLVHGHVGPQGVVLEQEAHLPLVGGDVDAQAAVEHHLVADGDAAAGGRLQARDHPQGGGLAAAGGAQQGDECVILYDQIQVVYRVEFSPVLGHVLQSDFRHGVNLLFLRPGLRR